MRGQNAFHGQTDTQTMWNQFTPKTLFVRGGGIQMHCIVKLCKKEKYWKKKTTIERNKPSWRKVAVANINKKLEKHRHFTNELIPKLINEDNLITWFWFALLNVRKELSLRSEWNMSSYTSFLHNVKKSMDMYGGIFLPSLVR